MSLPAYIHRLRVRYGETDQMGVVHHANYVLYAEEARTELMRHHGSSYAQMEKDGYALPVRSMQLRFRSPAHYEDELEIHTHVATLRGASVTFHSEMYRASDRTGGPARCVARESRAALGRRDRSPDAGGRAEGSLRPPRAVPHWPAEARARAGWTAIRPRAGRGRSDRPPRYAID